MHVTRPYILVVARSKMLAYLDSTRFLYNDQWGFRPAHSNACALASATHDWLTTLDSESGSSVCSILRGYSSGNLHALVATVASSR